MHMVSAQPLIAVSGVRSSWDTEEMNSFFMFSVLDSSSAIWLMEAQRSPISSWLWLSMRTEKSPLANFLVVALICLMGRMMERMKYTPVTTSSSSTPRHTAPTATA